MIPSDNSDIQKVFQYFERHFNQSITIKDMAKQLSIKKQHLSNI
ncbi:MAG TPA: AraC family transcriptional regulator [Flavobacteriaceae bacterium]|nr:AraC family transcriptional regulator [Flavobacteriaceae bacterium]